MNLPPIDIKKLTRKRRTDPLESKVEKDVCDYAASRGVDQRKYKTPQRRSAPDRIFFPGAQQCFFIEFKRFGKKPTPGQVKEHVRLREQGYEVYVVDNVQQGKQVIDLWLTLYR